MTYVSFDDNDDEDEEIMTGLSRERHSNMVRDKVYRLGSDLHARKMSIR